MKKVDQKITPLLFETYLAVVKNSVGSKMLRNFFARVSGKRKDVMNNGELSCAFYVSSVLALFKYCKAPHGSVDSTVGDLRKSGWKVAKKPVVGSVLVWSKMDFGKNDAHKHIGFYIGKDRAISNNYKLGYPTEHHWTFNSKRKIEMILWGSKIQQKKL
jgi:hypothetical protein